MNLFFKYSSTIGFTACVVSFLMMNTGCKAQNQNTQTQTMLSFSESKDFPKEERSRRKFDNAVIADLDQDGWLDLLLTEHARRVEVFWNNKGTYELGQPFIFGDTHGISVGDYNGDGLQEVLVQPGGGDGKNPRKLRAYTIYKDRTVSEENEFKHFEASRGRAVKFFDADNNGEQDLILSAFPPNKKWERAHFLYKRDTEKDFVFDGLLPYADRFNMRTTIIDFNNDGVKDFIFYGGSKIIAVKGGENFEFIDVSEEVLGNLTNTNLVNSVSEIDFDNDGDFDLFLTRSKHPFDSESDYNEETKTYHFFDRRRAFHHEIQVEGDLILENLQMAYPHFDINIGKNKTLYERTLDQHGGQNLTITQKEGEGFPKDTEKEGLYIGYLGNNKWRLSGHTDSPTSAVIHNVIGKPETISLKDLPAKLLENQNGTFVDVTAKLGIDLKEQTSSTAVGDFNNDGWSDLFVVRYGHSASKIEQFILLNNEGKNFNLIKNHGVVRTEIGSTGMGADALDYDKDGDLDIIYCNERGRWHLFTNNLKSDNNFVVVNVGNSPSGKALPIGAVLTLKSDGKIYKRAVGATSSSYSQGLDTYLHVGLGKTATIEEAMVTWSNGESLKLNLSEVNKVYNTN
ncbi:CRTAC1 family protein [Hyunsoonleella sp. SJ7]|uniref:CRTAC1 family protein n=1 Tax=Hyunsoonleella aquatilis TaxID=2762758 RepID=A0A923HDJ1_9FLAO|nr:CRTAC1 family protein [Hyunsoonleella aquatilis]MBC3759191.1 CRTAC1 family protein [Hyunsoonleella aquatilis]